MYKKKKPSPRQKVIANIGTTDDNNACLVFDCKRILTKAISKQHFNKFDLYYIRP